MHRNKSRISTEILAQVLTFADEREDELWKLPLNFGQSPLTRNRSVRTALWPILTVTVSTDLFVVWGEQLPYVHARLVEDLHHLLVDKPEGRGAAAVDVGGTNQDAVEWVEPQVLY